MPFDDTSPGILFLTWSIFNLEAFHVHMYHQFTELSNVFTVPLEWDCNTISAPHSINVHTYFHHLDQSLLWNNGFTYLTFYTQPLILQIHSLNHFLWYQFFNLIRTPKILTLLWAFFCLCNSNFYDFANILSVFSLFSFPSLCPYPKTPYTELTKMSVFSVPSP